MTEAEKITADAIEKILDEVELPEVEHYNTHEVMKENYSYPEYEKQAWEFEYPEEVTDMKDELYGMENGLYKGLKYEAFWFNPSCVIDGNKIVVTSHWGD